MAINLKGTSKYLNKYEGAHDILSSQAKFGFKESIWERVATGRDSLGLDMYIDALSKSDGLNLDELKNKYNTDYQDDNTELATLYNEIYGDHNTMVDVERVDAQGNKTKDTVSLYEYNAEIIKQTNDHNKHLHDASLKEESSGKIWADTVSIAGNFASGIDTFMSKTAATMLTLIDANTYNKTHGWNEVWKSYYKGGTFTESDMFFLDDKSVSEMLQDFEVDYTHFRDENGNLTTPGRYFVGASQTAGEMAASFVVNAGLSSVINPMMQDATKIGLLSDDATSFIGRALSTGTYYTPLAASSLSETYDALTSQGVSASTGTFMAHQLAKSAAEISIEVLLGKMLGPTGLDKWLFGKSGGHRYSLKKNKFLSYFGNIGMDLLQEGSEEVLQELSGVAIDNIFGKFVNEKFGELSEVTFQNLSDAFVIACLVSAGHASVSAGIGTAITPGRKIIDSDGNVKVMGKFSSYVQDVTLEGLKADYEEAQRRVIQTKSKHEKMYLPSERRLKEYVSTRDFLINYRDNLSEILESDSIAEIDDYEHKGMQLKKIELDSKIKDLDTKILELTEAVESERAKNNLTKNEKYNKSLEELGKQYAEDFQGVFAAAQLINAFCNQIGEERLTAANAILNDMTNYFRSGELDADIILAKFDEMVTALQLVDISLPVSLRERMRLAKQSKLRSAKKIDKTTNEFVDVIPSEEDTAEVENKIAELLKKTSVENLVVTEDGYNAVSDEETMSVPKNVLKHGVYETFKGDAESRLVHRIKEAKWQGNVLEKILDSYRRINNRPDAVMEDAIFSVCFDKAFFKTMLMGGDTFVKLADRDMYKFLSGLYSLSSSLAPNDLRTIAFKKTLADVRNGMLESLVEYLKYQPNVSEYPSYISESQLSEIKKCRESYDMYNRLIAHSENNPAPSSDWQVILKRLNTLDISEELRNALRKQLTSRKPAEVRKALASIDSGFRRMYYGSYDGRTYMPLNSIKNRAFNQFLYSRNSTIEALLDSLAKSKTLDEDIEFYNNAVGSYTGGRFGVKLTDKRVEPESGIFGNSLLRVEVVDYKNPSGYTKVSSGLDVISKVRNKTTVYAEKSHSDVVNTLIGGMYKSYSDYYSIDDLITNPQLLKKDVLATIKKEYGTVDSDSTYHFLKKFVSDATKGNSTLVLSNDGTVIFGEIYNTDKIIKTGITSVTDNQSLTDVLNPGIMKLCPFLANCKIRLIPETTPDIEPYFATQTDYRGRLEGRIYVPKSLVTGLKDNLRKSSRLKQVLSHEIQHAIQYSNHLALGTDSNVLDLFDTNTKLIVREDVKSHVPGLFENARNETEVMKIVNDFIYYCSGEIAAYGAQTAESIDFYPNVITTDGSTLTVTFPWGNSYKADVSETGKQSMVDVQDAYNEIESMTYGDSTLQDIKRLFDLSVDDDDVKFIGERLFAKADSMLKSMHADNFKIRFIDNETMSKIYNGNRLAEGIYIGDSSSPYYGINFNLDVLRIDDSSRVATVIAHEVIHGLTCKLFTVYKTDPSMLSENTKKALDDLHSIYGTIKVKSGMTLIKSDRDYAWTSNDVFDGTRSVEEFAADLTNTLFRENIKEKNFVKQIVDAVKRLFGISDVLKSADKALLRILDLPDASFEGMKDIKIKESYASTTDDGPVEKIGGQAHLKSKGVTPRKRVSVKATKGTPLEPFARRKLSVPLQEFVMKSGDPEYRDINKELKKKIRLGTLMTSDVMEWLRNADSEKESDELTFKLANDTIFHNKFITSLKELDEYVTVRTPNYYALRTMVNKFFQNKDWLKDVSNDEIYDRVLDVIKNDKHYSKIFLNIYDSYDLRAIPDEKNLRRLWMQYFDGSIESGGYISGVAKVTAYMVLKGSWSSTSIGSSSISSTVGKSKDGKSTLLREETISQQDKEDFSNFVTSERRDLLYEMMKPGITLDFIERKKRGENVTMDDLTTALSNNAIRIKELSDQDFIKEFVETVKDSDDLELAQTLYVKTLIKEALGESEAITLEEAADELELAEENKYLVKEYVRTRVDIMSNIRGRCRTIKNNLDEKSKKRFLKINGDLFNDDLTIKDELYREVLPPKNPAKSDRGVTRLKDEPTLLELEERVRQISQEVRQGAYDDDRFAKYRARIEKRNRELIEGLTVAKKERKKTKTVVEQTVVMQLINRTIEFRNAKSIPRIVTSLLSTKLEHYDKTRVQLVSNDNEQHLVMNYKEFISQNVEVLSGITDDDVAEIVEFYQDSEIISSGGENVSTIYRIVKQSLLAYLLEMSGKVESKFSLTSEQLEWVNQTLDKDIHDAAAELVNWREILKRLKTPEMVIKSSMKICGLKLNDSDEAELVAAINSGDIVRISRAKSRAFNNLMKDAKTKKQKQSLTDRLLRFERMAMLSGPGTWVRNEVSNWAVSGLNALSETITKWMPRSEIAKKSNQYRITGTKVSDSTARWIESEIFSSGFYDLISDGLIKQDVSSRLKVSSDNMLGAQMANLIKHRIESDLFGALPQVNSKKELYEYVKSKGTKSFTVQTSSEVFEKFVQLMLSDEKFVRKSFKRYLGKMLTEDGVELSKGINSVLTADTTADIKNSVDIMDTIAQSYVLAAHDYMHRSNAWTKMEQHFKSLLHQRYGASTANAVYFTYKQIFPFAGSSWNWFVESLNYTPLGLVNSIIQYAKLENTINSMDEAQRKGNRIISSRFAEYVTRRNIGKGMIGGVGFVIGCLLAAFGKVKFDDDKYELVVNDNGRPVSFDISQIFGSSGILCGMSFIQSFVDENGFNINTFEKVFVNGINTMFLDSTFSDLINTFRYSDSIGDMLFDMPLDTIGMFVPNFIKSTTGLFKKYEVAYDPGLLGRLERFSVQSFGPASYAYSYKIDPYTGDAQLVNNGWFWLNVVNKFTPLKVENAKMSDAEVEARSLGITRGELKGEYSIGDSKVKLNREDTEKSNIYYGSLNKKDLDDLINNRTKYFVENSDGKRLELTYSKMTDKQKKAVIERIMSDNSRLAKIYILTQNGYKYYATDSEYGELKDAGIITNVYRQTKDVKGFVKVS